MNIYRSAIAILDKRGGDAIIGLNRVYLLEALQTLTDDEVTIGYGEPLDQACFHGTAKDVNVIMPVRI